MKQKIFMAIHILVLIIISILIVGSFFIRGEFPEVSFDELYFYLTNGVTNSDSNVFIVAIKTCLPFFVLLMVLFYAVFYDITFGHKKLKYAVKMKNTKNKGMTKSSSKIKSKKKTGKTKTIQIYPFEIVQKHRVIATTILFIFTLIIAANNINCINFIKNSNTESKFIEINYVNPKEAEISFDKKKNLIMIFVESLETTFFTEKQGGSWKYEVTPELYKLLNDKDATVFYGENKAELMTMVEGASWTTASLVANTAGLPFKVPIDGNEYHSDNFMNGAYTLGDVLKAEGYHNELISTARTSFGGVKEFFTKHGDYDIIDSDSLKDYNLSIKNKDYNYWGFNDRYLFDATKKRLKLLSKEDKPFNLELVTIDTHFTDGFVYDFSSKKYDTQYENAYATTSKLIYDFVSWVKKQDFYDDTTIVIMGDHLSMQTNYFTERGATDRYVYCCYINADKKADNNKDRVYTALDTYPSVISAIGGGVDGERLGLGVNLFSSKKTLSERYGFEKLNKEVAKKSEFYNDKILGDDYKDMLENKE